MIVQSLDSVWEFRQVGSDEVFKARVPGCVHTDLVRVKKIEDPFKGDNEYKVAWVHETDWEYSRSFDVGEKLLKNDRVYLECDGLDTFARITLNSQVLAETDNMHIVHSFDVTDKLRVGGNTIGITFASPVNRVKPLMAKDPLVCPSDSIPGACYTRKSPSQWGWDWGPKLPTSGIRRSIRLAGYQAARIDELRIRQKHRRGGEVTLNVEVGLEKFQKALCTVLIRLTHPDGKVEELSLKSGGERQALGPWNDVVRAHQALGPARRANREGASGVEYRSGGACQGESIFCKGILLMGRELNSRPIRRYVDLTPLRPVNSDITNRTMKATKTHLNMVAAMPASVPNPRIAATSATIAKNIAHPNIPIPPLC